MGIVRSAVLATCLWPCRFIVAAGDTDAGAEWRIEPTVYREPIRIIQQDADVGCPLGLFLVERLLYAEFLRPVLAVLDEFQADAYSGLRVCGDRRCGVVRHADLKESSEREAAGFAYLVAEEDHAVWAVDEVAAARHRRLGRIADLGCTVTCEGCYHSNEVELWGAAFRHIWSTGDVITAMLVGDADAAGPNLFGSLVERGHVPVEEVFVPLQSRISDTVRGAELAMGRRRHLDVLHVEMVPGGQDPCGSLVSLLDYPWAKKPRIVSHLPNRDVPPPFRARSAKGCSLGWLVAELSQRGYVLWKHTDRITLFRLGHMADAPDEVLCFAAYPLLERKDSPGTIARTREWLISAADDAPATLEQIRSVLGPTGVSVDL